MTGRISINLVYLEVTVSVKVYTIYHTAMQVYGFETLLNSIKLFLFLAIVPRFKESAAILDIMKTL